MSYILDALRRADAERQRGVVPGLHAQPPQSAQQGTAGAGRSVPLAWVLGGGLGLLLIAGAAWLFARNGGQAPSTGPVSAAPALPSALPGTAPPGSTPAPHGMGTTAAPQGPAAPPAVAPAQAPALPNPQAATTQAAGTTTVTVTVSGPTVAAPARTVTAAALPSAVRAASAPARTASALVPAASAAEPPPAALTATTPVPALSSLPEAFRRQLPALSLGGGMYSEQPAQRLVLVNGQVAREGDDLGNGLQLLQIRPRSVVFTLRDQRFEVAM